MDKEELKKRCKNFAHRCVKLSLALPEDYLGRHIKRQLIRCSTSVAANYRAVCTAQSRAAFVAKLATVIEEADEACFWMEFIIEEKLFDSKKLTDLIKEAKELTAIFIASQNTARKNSK